MPAPKALRFLHYGRNDKILLPGPVFKCLVAEQGEQHLVGRAFVFRVILENGSLEVLDGYAGLGIAKGLRDGQAKEGQRFAGNLPIRKPSAACALERLLWTLPVEKDAI